MSLPLMAVGSHLFVNIDHLEQAGLVCLPTPGRLKRGLGTI